MRVTKKFKHEVSKALVFINYLYPDIDFSLDKNILIMDIHGRNTMCFTLNNEILDWECIRIIGREIFGDEYNNTRLTDYRFENKIATVTPYATPTLVHEVGDLIMYEFQAPETGRRLLAFLN